MYGRYIPGNDWKFELHYMYKASERSHERNGAREKLQPHPMPHFSCGFFISFLSLEKPGYAGYTSCTDQFCQQSALESTKKSWMPIQLRYIYSQSLWCVLKATCFEQQLLLSRAGSPGHQTHLKERSLGAHHRMTVLAPETTKILFTQNKTICSGINCTTIRCCYTVLYFFTYL